MKLQELIKLTRLAMQFSNELVYLWIDLLFGSTNQNIDSGFTKFKI